MATKSSEKFNIKFEHTTLEGNKRLKWSSRIDGAVSDFETPSTMIYNRERTGISSRGENEMFTCRVGFRVEAVSIPQKYRITNPPPKPTHIKISSKGIHPRGHLRSKIGV